MKYAVTALAVAALAGSALAQETFVVPDDIPTLQDALDPAISGIDPGDIIVLRDVIRHTGTFVVDVADLTIRAADGESPVLDANGAGDVITFISGGSLTLEGLTIEDGGGIGNSDTGSGVFATHTGPLTMIRCVVRDNNSIGSGGGLFLDGVDATIVGCEFVRNDAERAGGAAFLLGFGSLTIRDSAFTDNSAADNGGALGYDVGGTVSPASISIEGSTFSRNEAGAGGGAVSVDGAASLLIDGCRFTDNSAVDDPSGDGGAVIVTAVEVTDILQTEFSANASNDTGGAIRFSGGADSRPARVIESTFQANQAAGGGAVFALGSGEVEFIACDFFGNQANRGRNEGGAVSAGQSAVRFSNTLFDANVADDGGALLLTAGARFTALNCTFVNNTTNSPGSTAVQSIRTDTSVVMRNNIFNLNQPLVDPVDASVSTLGVDVSFNLFDAALDGTLSSPGGGSTGNIFGDVQFADASTRDYALLAGSPGIDAGSSSLYHADVFADFAGNLRVQDDPDTADVGESVFGPVIDMGALEFNVVTSSPLDECPADQNQDGVLNGADFNAWLSNFAAGCD